MAGTLGKRVTTEMKTDDTESKRDGTRKRQREKEMETERRGATREETVGYEINPESNVEERENGGKDRACRRTRRGWQKDRCAVEETETMGGVAFNSIS